MMKSPVLRLVVRALLAGAASFLATVQAGGGNYSSAALAGAGTAAGLAALEVLTPLNTLVGLSVKTSTGATDASEVPPPRTR